jgi:hypothetical protein
MKADALCFVKNARLTSSSLSKLAMRAGSTNTLRGHVAEWLEEINGETIKIEAGQD